MSYSSTSAISKSPSSSSARKDAEFMRFPSDSESDDVECAYVPLEGVIGSAAALAKKRARRKKRLAICCGVGWTFAIVVGLVGYFAVAPKIAQSLLDKGKMSVVRVEMGRVFNMKRNGAIVDLNSIHRRYDELAVRRGGDANRCHKDVLRWQAFCGRKSSRCPSLKDPSSTSRRSPI